MLSEMQTAQLGIMQQALGEQWQALPRALQAHYQHNDNVDEGTLDVEYPRPMQLVLNMLALFGALLNRRGMAIPTRVEKRLENGIQYWQRCLWFPDGKCKWFSSKWEYTGGNRITEYVNPVLGLCMRVYVKEQQLHYEGLHYALRFGRLTIAIPEWLMLGHTSIVETAINDNHFAMDFRLHHPLFGQVYRYTGTFETRALAPVME